MSRRFFLTDGKQTIELTDENFSDHIEWVDVGPLRTTLGVLAETAYIMEAADEEDAKEAALKLLGCTGMNTPNKVRITGCTWATLPAPGIPKSAVPFYRTPGYRNRDD